MGKATWRTMLRSKGKNSGRIEVASIRCLENQCLVYSLSTLVRLLGAVCISSIYLDTILSPLTLLYLLYSSISPIRSNVAFSPIK